MVTWRLLTSQRWFKTDNRVREEQSAPRSKSNKFSYSWKRMNELKQRNAMIKVTG